VVVGPQLCTNNIGRYAVVSLCWRSEDAWLVDR